MQHRVGSECALALWLGTGRDGTPVSITVPPLRRSARSLGEQQKRERCIAAVEVPKRLCHICTFPDQYKFDPGQMWPKDPISAELDRAYSREFTTT